MKQILQYIKNGMTGVEHFPVPEVNPGRVIVQQAWSLVSAVTVF